MEAQTLDLLDKDIKVTVLDMFKELKQNIAKDQMKIWNSILILKIWKNNRNYKAEQIDILEVKNTTEMKNLLERVNSRFEHIENRVRKNEDRSAEIIQPQGKREKNNE